MDVVLCRQAYGDSSPMFSPKDLSMFMIRHHEQLRADFAEFLKDDIFKPQYDLSFYEYRELTQERLKKIAKGNFVTTFDHIHDPLRFMCSMQMLTFVDYSITIKCGVHYSLAGGAIALLGTKKHHDKYLPLIDSARLPGCFGMTELGHGSNVMGIETTATYKHSSRSFILNTPDDLASKVWIGGASQYGKLCTVFAQLYVNGEWQGVHVFAVRIRDDEGNVCPRIRIEEMGHKMGLNGVDNGRIWFNNVEIDKDSLLDRYASIDEEGVYKSPIPSVAQRFGVMVGALSTGRVCIAQSAVDACKLGLTIASRYSSDRPQFGDKKIISYLTHQRRLAPAVAQTYALDLIMLQLTGVVSARGDAKQIHVLSSGLKAAATWTRVEILQNCRECCGGMGFLTDNQIAGLICDMNVDVTFEGDNTVLMQQVVKATITRGIRRPEPVTAENFSIEVLMKVLKYREELLRYRITQASDFDKNLDLAVDLGWAYVDFLTLQNFAREVSSAPPKLQEALGDLCMLYALERMERHAVFYFCEGVLSPAKLESLRQAINDLCAKVCGNDGERLVRYCAGFGIPEHLITAPIAKSWRDFHTVDHLTPRL